MSELAVVIIIIIISTVLALLNLSSVAIQRENYNSLSKNSCNISNVIIPDNTSNINTSSLWIPCNCRDNNHCTIYGCRITGSSYIPVINMYMNNTKIYDLYHKDWFYIDFHHFTPDTSFATFQIDCNCDKNFNFTKHLETARQYRNNYLNKSKECYKDNTTGFVYFFRRLTIIYSLYYMSLVYCCILAIPFVVLFAIIIGASIYSTYLCLTGQLDDENTPLKNNNNQPIQPPIINIHHNDDPGYNSD